MIEQLARVIAVGDGVVQVQAESMSQCARCAEGKGCGGAVFARLFGMRSFTLSLPSTQPLQADDTVLLALDETFLLRASFRLYGLPILLFVAGALLGHQFGGGLWTLLVALGGLALALWWLHRFPPAYEKHLKISRKSAGNPCDLQQSS